MTTYIAIDIMDDRGFAVDCNVYLTDTDEEIAVAQAAIAAAGLLSAPVWAGDPSEGDSYKTGGVLFAAAAQ